MRMRPEVDTGYLLFSLFTLSSDREPAWIWCTLIDGSGGHCALRIHLCPLFYQPMIEVTEKCGHPEFAWVLEI